MPASRTVGNTGSSGTYADPDASAARIPVIVATPWRHSTATGAGGVAGWPGPASAAAVAVTAAPRSR